VDGWIDARGTARLAMEGGLEQAALPPPLVEAATGLDVDVGELYLGVALARKLPEPAREAFVLLMAAARLAHARGSTRLPLTSESLASHLRDLGMPESLDPVLDLVGHLHELAPIVGEPGEYAPLIVDAGHLYAQRMHALETRVAEHVRLRIRTRAIPETLDAAIADVVAEPPRFDGHPAPLSEEQRAAVRAACIGKLTLISGEPGTGKTSIVVSILRVLARLGQPLDRIALAAPTGKAADRMRRSIEATLERLGAPGLSDVTLLHACPPSQTLHRLLGYSRRGGRFRHHEGDPLGEDVVIVDESSMIDLPMVDRLLRALRPDARLVLLGDAEQLPSVDVGAVFRDLCRAVGEQASVRLTKSYRMDPKDPSGRHVLKTGRAINAGQSGKLFGRGGIHRRRVAELRFDQVEQVGADERDAFLARWFDEHARLDDALTKPTYRSRAGAFGDADTTRLRRLFERLERARILCLTRGRATGIDAINRAFHERIQARGMSTYFAVGEPVLVQRNDYERGLFNGDQGVVLWVAGTQGPARPSAVFRRDAGFVAFPLDAIRGRLDLAHAVTVHKAQGSEHEVVAVVLPDEEIPLLTRELLYTGLTRARKSAVLVGDPRLVQVGAERFVERSSGLAERV